MVLFNSTFTIITNRRSETKIFPETSWQVSSGVAPCVPSVIIHKTMIKTDKMLWKGNTFGSSDTKTGAVFDVHTIAISKSSRVKSTAPKSSEY